MTSIGVESDDPLDGSPSKPGESTYIFSNFRFGTANCLGLLGVMVGTDGVMSEVLVMVLVVDTGANGGINALDFSCNALGIGSCLSGSCSKGSVKLGTSLGNFSDNFCSLKNRYL